MFRIDFNFVIFRLIPHQSENGFVCLARGNKIHIMTCQYKNPFYDSLVEKSRVRDEKNIKFTRVVITLALLGHQTLHSQNKFFFPSWTIYYYVFNISAYTFIVYLHYKKESHKNIWQNQQNFYWCNHTTVIFWSKFSHFDILSIRIVLDCLRCLTIVLLGR